MLRYPVLVCVEHTGVDLIAECPQALIEPNENCAVVPGGKVGHILDQDSGRAKMFDNGHEAVPKGGPRILARALSCPAQLPDLGATGTRERLARPTAGDEVNGPDSPLVQVLQELVGLAEV